MVFLVKNSNDLHVIATFKKRTYKQAKSQELKFITTLTKHNNERQMVSVFMYEFIYILKNDMAWINN